MDCVMTTDYITERWDYEHLKKFALQVIVFIVCLHRIVQVQNTPIYNWQQMKTHY